MRSLLELDESQLVAWLQEQGEPRYRAAQIRRWVFERRAEDFESMNDLPKSLRARLAEHFVLWQGEIDVHSRATDGTEKLLLKWPSGAKIECVLIREGDRRTICISSQVGCAMGCVFCASGLDGVERNLSHAEIVEQMLRLQRLLPADERLSHIVVMGMGEPLANLDNVLVALREANAKTGLDISARRITISTVGLPPALRRLTQEEPRYHLAVSLHAPNDALRSEIVPVNRKIGIEAVMEAADEYFEASGRRLTFEYVLLGQLNDSPQHARELAALLRGRTALLNVIPYNPVAGLPYKTPSPEAIDRFRGELEQRGINVQFRQRKGDEINAACGQLRRATQGTIPSKGTVPSKSTVPLSRPTTES
ncbi:MAG: 23S rRNA (adenine(2503)-C(2))-methyltransferase RlmN [Planctomycetales bacterium]|nr:23S rRNA (adenine(2503)-C(2))-methyltransferase RlmN [Planctomycetales bacterium]